MTLQTDTLEFVRQRAGFACEFCGITEIDAGNRLTIDHFQPGKHGGNDYSDNLIYACFPCNQYKGDYWPATSEAVPLWNPRREAFHQHFLELNDGMLTALTAVGTFTMRRLRLNRPQLVQHRLHKRQQQELVRVLQQYREQVGLLEQLNQELGRQINEQRKLLQTERELLRLLLADDNEEIL